MKKKMYSQTNITKLIEIRKKLLKSISTMKSNQEIFGRHISGFISENKVRPVRNLKNIEIYETNEPIAYFLLDYIREESSLFKRLSHERELGDYFSSNPKHSEQLSNFVNKKKARMNNLLSRYLVSIDESIVVEVFGNENDFEYVVKIEGWGYFWIKRMALKANCENFTLRSHNLETLAYVKLKRVSYE